MIGIAALSTDKAAFLLMFIVRMGMLKKEKKMDHPFFKNCTLEQCEVGLKTLREERSALLELMKKYPVILTIAGYRWVFLYEKELDETISHFDRVHTKLQAT